MKVFLYEILIWKKKTMMSAWNRDYKSILLIKNDKIAFFFCFKLNKKIDYRQQMVKLYFKKKN